MMGLTDKQRELLAYLHMANSAQVTPTFEEMRRHLGLSSKSGVQRLLNGLQERGYIKRIPNRARAIELLESNVLARFTNAELQAELDRRRRAA